MTILMRVEIHLGCGKNISLLDEFTGSTLSTKVPWRKDGLRSIKEARRNISFLETMMEKVLPVTIIIDDGSHISKDVITTFKFLFPKLRKGGWYVVEDIQTSYWREFEGDPENLKNPRTSMNFFKQITDCVNSSEFERAEGSDGTFDGQIDAVHFYYNMMLIKKK